MIMIEVLRVIHGALRHYSVPRLLFVALLIRFVLTVYEVLNVHYDSEDIHIELVDVSVVTLGFLLVAVHGIATIDTMLCLWKYAFIDLYRRQVLRLSVWCNGKSIGTLFVTVLCFFNGIAMFFLVREVWTSHLCSVIQILHIFPALAKLSQTISNGVLICVTPVLRANETFTRADHKSAVTAHQVSNGLILLYAVLNSGVVIQAVSCSKLYLAPIIVGLVCRLTLLSLLESPDGPWFQNVPLFDCKLVRDPIKLFLNQWSKKD